MLVSLQYLRPQEMKLGALAIGRRIDIHDDFRLNEGQVRNPGWD